MIYFWEPAAELCYMLFAYPKSDQEDLTAAQLKQQRRLVREKFK